MDSDIIKTLCYADIFNAGLTLPEIYRYLISKKKYSYSRVEKSVEKMVASHKIFSAKSPKTSPQKKVYWLEKDGSKHKSHFSRLVFSRNKLNKTRNSILKLSKIPTIQAIYITGSLSRMNAKLKDDVDIMIVCKKNTLWQTRILVTVFLDMIGKRRKPEDQHTGREVKDKICPNLYLAETALTVPLAYQNLYTAHEVVQAQVVFDRSSITTEFLTENSWVRDYLPHSPLPSHRRKKQTYPDSFTQIFFTSQVESACFGLQKLYMHSKRTREVVERDKAYFHPRDTSKTIMTEYKQRLDKYL